MIPGSNVLKMALSVIAKQQVSYYKFLSRTNNSIGVLEPTYAAPVLIFGSFQTVPKRLYEQYGLDFQKAYATFYTANKLLDIQRDVSSDYIVFNNLVYQCESSNDWYAVDGWMGMLCVLVNDPNLNIFGFEKSFQNFGNGAFGD